MSGCLVCTIDDSGYKDKQSLFGSAGLISVGDRANCSVVEKASEDVRSTVLTRIGSAQLWHIPGESAESSRTHLISPEPFALSIAQVEQLRKLGDALLAFYSGVNELYLRGGREWVNEYLDIGKTEDLLRHARMKYQRAALPGVIRPDILITEDGFKITELDSVPGGFGHLDCLSAAYEDAGFELVGSRRGIRERFAAMLRSAASTPDPVAAIVVSDESVDYLPEMTYLAGELREAGVRAFTVRPREVVFTEEGLYIETEGGRLRVDVLYRFLELFDLLNIPKSELVSYAARKKLVAVTPPYKPFLEEKMLLALFHSRSLEDYWRGALGEEHYDILSHTLTETHILDNRPVPPHAEISGYQWRGEPIRDWRAICDGTQKERRLVLKPSGFSELAWGSRGVKIGHDMSGEEWAAAVDGALGSFDSSPYVLQHFQETALIGVKYFGEPGGEVCEMQARVRLCPYYFAVDGRAELGGVLATACPKDKKLIHGMVDAIMAPCRMH